MEYIYLITAMICSAGLSIMSTIFGKENSMKSNTSGAYSMLVTVTAFVIWGIIYIYEEQFNIYVIKYSVAFGILYTVAMVGMFKAYQVGTVSLTAFVKQLSLIGVAFWGLIFWNNPLGSNVIVGLVVIVIALYLCFKTDIRLDTKKVTTKWCIYAFMLLIGNAGCSIVQKYQQMEFNDEYTSLFMFIGAGMAFVSSLIFYLSANQCKLKHINAKTVIYPVVGGICSATLNYLIILLISSPISESVIFPTIAVGGLLITIFFSVIVYKEKINIIQSIGLVIGVIALILLNI